MWMREKETNTSTTLKLTEEENFTKYTLRDEIRPEEKRPANSTFRLCMNTCYFKKSQLNGISLTMCCQQHVL